MGTALQINLDILAKQFCQQSQRGCVVHIVTFAYAVIPHQLARNTCLAEAARTWSGSGVHRKLTKSRFDLRCSKTWLWTFGWNDGSFALAQSCLGKYEWVMGLFELAQNGSGKDCLKAGHSSVCTQLDIQTLNPALEMSSQRQLSCRQTILGCRSK